MTTRRLHTHDHRHRHRHCHCHRDGTMSVQNSVHYRVYGEINTAEINAKLLAITTLGYQPDIAADTCKNQ